MQFHPAASLFPMLPDDELQSLAASIKAHGLLEPIKTHEGKIIDGRNRMTACTLAGVQPEFQPAPVNGSAADYVFAVNDKRRHLTEGARAIAAGRYKELAAEEAKERQKRKPADSVVDSVPPQKNKARDAAGDKFGVSGKTVDRAAHVVKHGAPELVKAVEAGRVPVAVAAKVAELPKSQQREVVALGKSAIKAAVKAVEAPKKISDTFFAALKGLSERIDGIREQYGTAAQMFESDVWANCDKNDVYFVIELVHEIAAQFNALDKEMQAYAKRKK